MSDLERIKQKIDIVSFISEFVPLKKAGANFKGLCPFHSEKTPSFIVSPERQIWRCFGACQEGGDIFKFLMKMENLEFTEALKILAQRAGVTLTAYRPSKNTEIKERILTANHLAADFYHHILVTHLSGQKARDYLDSRRITHNSIKLFNLGYAPNSWDLLSRFLTKKGFSVKEQELAGLVSRTAKGEVFDRFRGRIMFPLFDHYRNIVGFAGRLLDPKAKEAKYINTPETLVYTKGNVLYGLHITREEIKRKGYSVVVEGEIDLISSYQIGVRNVVAVKGSALTAGQVNLLKRYTENIYLSFDSDVAGNAAAFRGIELASKAGLNIKIVSLNEAKDPDDLIKKNPVLWIKAVEKAVSLYDYVIEIALKRNDLSSIEGKKRVVAEVAPFIASIDNLIVKDHYFRKLAKELSTPQEVVEAQISKELKKTFLARRSPSPSVPSLVSKSPAELFEEYLLSLLLQSPNPSDYLLLISSRLKPEDFFHPNLGEIYRLLLSFTAGRTDFDIKEFILQVPPESVDLVDRLYLQENNIDVQNCDLLEEIRRTAWKVKDYSLREKLKMISRDLGKDPDNEDLKKAFSDVTASLQKLAEEQSLLAL